MIEWSHHHDEGTAMTDTLRAEYEAFVSWALARELDPNSSDSFKAWVAEQT